MVEACLVVVNNTDEETEKYIVARPIDSELWFWGSYDNEEEAIKVAKLMDGIVVEKVMEG